MSELLRKQFKFSVMVSELISFITFSGYSCTFGDAFRDKRCPYGSKKSLHHLRLAVDLNIFKDGVYLKDSADLKLIGEFWESLGGSWGGRFSHPDGNHFSLSYNGLK